VRTAAAILAVTVTVAGLSACSAQADVTPAATSSAVPTESTAEDGLSDGLDVSTADPADEESTAAAVTVAEKLMTAFARPDVDKTTWINGLYPYLTQAAGTAYAGTDPAKVPVSDVTGSGTVVEGQTEYALLVTVPTNVGPYVISLVRETPADQWLATRITPPAK
jgi:hypothetical protein